MTQPMQTVIGTSLPTDAAYIANMAANNNLTARGQDVSMRGQDIQVMGLLAQFEQQGQQALQEYYNNVAQFGLDKARSIYEQRLAKATVDLQAATTGGQQRLGAGQLKLDTMKALADRSGPQNWVGYDYMLGGLGQPTGQRVDPFSWADSVVDPRFNDPNHDWAGNLADESLFSGLQGPRQAVTGGMPSSLTSMKPGSVTPWQYQLQQSSAPLSAPGAGAPAAYPPGSINADRTPNSAVFGQAPKPAYNISGQAPEDIFSGVRNQDVAGLTPGQRALLTTGTAGPSKASDYVGFNVYEPGSNRQYGADESIAGGLPIWLQRLAGGGPMTDRAAIVGEGASAENLGQHGEIILNPTGAPIDVIKNDDAKRALSGGYLDKLKGYAGGTVIDDPRYYAKDAAGQGVQITHTQGADGGWNGYYADGTPAYQAVGNDPAYAWARASRPSSRPGITPGPGAANVQSYGDPVFGAGAGGGGLAGAAASATDATGGDWGMPDTPDYIKYDPATIGQQPFIQALIRGQRGGGSFAGLGSSLGNPKLGVSNIPTNINVQGFRDMDSSQRQAAGSLYSQGLGVDFGDITGRAEKAAPRGVTTGRKRYGF